MLGSLPRQPENSHGINILKQTASMALKSAGRIIRKRSTNGLTNGPWFNRKQESRKAHDTAVSMVATYLNQIHLNHTEILAINSSPTMQQAVHQCIVCYNTLVQSMCNICSQVLIV